MRNRSITVFLITLLLLAQSAIGFAQSESGQENTRPRRAASGVRLSMQEIKSYEQTIPRLKKLLMTVPYYFDGYCNIARMYALLGQKKEALDWLSRAVDKGLIDSELIAADQSFQQFHDESAFQEIVKKSNQKVGTLLKDDQPFLRLAGPAVTKEKKFPLLVLLHGEGENAIGISDLMRPVADRNGFVVSAPQGKYLVADGHYQWGRRIDAEELVLQAIKQAKEKYPIDQERVYLIGFSQGGYMSLSIGLSHPDLFAGIIAIAPYYIHSLVSAKLEKAKARDLHVYLGVGENSYPNILSNNREAKELLEQAGIKVDLKLYRDTGHAFPPNVSEEMEQALKWVDNGRGK
jgi:phospholipase/carboxylesterase